ncbi:MAG: antitoxin Xre/MbcA/ParS toxin-binding domain-containing protein [Candidatus Krumholzibacteriota bacterium]
MSQTGILADRIQFPDTKKFWKIICANAGTAHPYLVFLGLRKFDTPRLLDRIDDGLSFASFNRLRHNINLSQEELADLVQISPRTLARRRADKRMETDESDRLVRLSRVFGKTVELFEGDDASAREWLARPQVGLGGKRPLDLLGSEVGAREVEALIDRLEHGVFA